MGSSFSMFNNKRRLITTRSQLDQEINLFLNRNQTHHQDHLSTNTIIDHQQQHQDQLISSFLEIAIGQTHETAMRFLQATNWNIEESVNLFFIKNNNNNYDHWHDIRVDEQPRSSYRELDPSLSSLYRPPIDLVFEGSFEEAKSVSSRENLWLLVNLQSRTEFASLTLNRDLWSNDAVLESVRSRFVLWQVYDHTTQGKKISNFYRIDSGPPVVLVIDPITGQKMRMWSGAIDAQSFVEDLVRFMEEGPNEHIYSLIRKRYPEAKVTCLSSYNTFQAPPPSWGEEFEEEDACSSSNNIEQTMVPSWGEEFEEEDACSSSNNIEQTMVPSWGEEFEEEDACSSSNNIEQTMVPSWGEEFEEEDACSSSNNIEQIMVPSWGEEFEEEDACSSSNNIEQTMVPSWGEEFEEEDAFSSSNNIEQIMVPSLGEEFEKEDACSSSNNIEQTMVPSWSEEFEKEDACSSSNNTDHNKTEQVMSPSGEEFEKEDTFSTSNNIEKAVAPSWGEEFDKEVTCLSRNNTDQAVSPSCGEEETSLEYPDLTEEPNEDCDRNIVCGICVRFPDGRRKQRRFLKTEPVQLLWSFCYSNMDDSDKKKLFKLVHAIPGACKTLDYGDNLTFDQSRLANSMISVAWE